MVDSETHVVPGGGGNVIRVVYMQEWTYKSPAGQDVPDEHFPVHRACRESGQFWRNITCKHPTCVLGHREDH